MPIASYRMLECCRNIVSHLTLLVILHLLSAVTALFTDSTPGICHPGWEQLNRRCYKLAGSEVATWFEADKLCQASGARLLFVDSPSDDAIIKNLRGKVPESGKFIWARHNPANRIIAVADDELTGATCYGLEVTPGRPTASAVGVCLEYRPYICEMPVDQGPIGRNGWVSSEVDPNHLNQQPTANILKLSGGILAGLIVGLLVWIATGIALVVYLRRRSSRRDIRRIFDDANPSSNKDEQGEITLEPLQATEVIIEDEEEKKELRREED